MRRYLLDTGPLTAFLFNRPGALSLMTPWIRDQEAAISILVYAEVTEHIKGRPNVESHQRAPHLVAGRLSLFPHLSDS